MTAVFWTSALAIVGLAWSLLWAGQRRPPTRATAWTNAALLGEELALLDADHAAGVLDEGRHREAVASLNRRLLAETSPAAIAAPVAPGSKRLIAGLAIALPAFVAGGYLWLGNPAALRVEAVAPAADEVSQADIEKMVDQLARRLQESPAGRVDDLPGWVMLARSQAALRRFGDAAAAYERAVALAPGDAQLLADLADVLSIQQVPAGQSSPAPARAAALVDRALAIDPDNLKALALAGNAAFDRRDTAAAIGFWRRARAHAPAGSDFANGMDRSLAEAGAPAVDGGAPGDGALSQGLQAGGGAPGPTAQAGETAVAAAGRPAPTGAGRVVSGDVRIDPALAGRIGPDDTLFVFARAAEGPRMPLAILRRPAASTVPGSFLLDDGMAMSPQLRLSNYGAVVVGARISRSGNALPQSGDLVGEARADAGSGRIELVIDRVQP